MTVTVLLFWSSVLLFDTSVCSTMTFPPFRNSDPVAVSVSIDFPSNSKQDASFHGIAYDYYLAGWDGLLDHWRDFPC